MKIIIITGSTGLIGSESVKFFSKKGFKVLGIDNNLSRKTALYLRHRYFSFEDRNFELDNNNGHETTLELKVTF